MWLFTRYGFYSIVCARNPDGALDTETLLVRARSEDHLQRLRGRFPALAEYQVIFSTAGDYAFRLIVPKRTLAPIVAEMLMEVEWSNFRNEVAAYQGAAGQHYLEAVHDVWDRMAHL